MTSLGFYFFLLFNISFFLHFAYRFPVLSLIRIDLLLVICMFGCLLFSHKKIITDDISRKFKLIIIYIILSLPLVKWPGSVLYYGAEFYLKAIVFFIFTKAFADTEAKLKVLVWIFIGCQIFRILEPGYLHITEGYWGSSAYSMSGGELSRLDRLASAPGDVLNPTQFGGLIVTIIPFLYFLLWKTQGKLFKLLFLCLMPVCMYVLFLTGARSAIVCLVVVVFTIYVFDSGAKINLKSVIYPAIVVTLLFFISFHLLPPEMAERYSSIYDSSAKGHDTAAKRISGLKAGFVNVLIVRNVFGHGLGTSAEVNYNLYGHHVISHSFYVEVIQEVGFLGLILFIKFVQSIFKSLALARQRIETGEKKYLWELNLIKALQAWTVMYLVYSIICFGFSSWEWYLFGGFAAVISTLTNQLHDKAEDKINLSS